MSIKFLNSSITLSIFTADVNSYSTNKNNKAFNLSCVNVVLNLFFTMVSLEKVLLQPQLVTGIITNIYKHKKKENIKNIGPITNI